jgi:uncharacterized protein
MTHAEPTHNLRELIRGMHPVLNPGTFVYATLRPGEALDPDRIIASMREPEGMSVIVDAAYAEEANLAPLLLCAWITLTVHSALDAVGLTAAFATALGDAGISCNVVAGARHDHLFVPEDQANAAMDALLRMQRSSMPE